MLVVTALGNILCLGRKIRVKWTENVQSSSDFRPVFTIFITRNHKIRAAKNERTRSKNQTKNKNSTDLDDAGVVAGSEEELV